LVTELRSERQVANVSQRTVARELDWQQSELNRLERFGFPNVSLVRLAEIAAVLGLRLTARLDRVGDPIRDGASQALIGRFTSLVGSAYRITREALLPNGGQRSWDVLLRLGSHLVGVEAVTRIRDVQALVRHTRLREREGGVEHILLVLSNSSHNRTLVGQLLEALGPRFATSPADIIRALKAGKPVPGSGVILL
jgi:transcriptional regulator with XRE-family HTH domain